MKTGTAGWTRESLSSSSFSNMRGEARRTSLRRLASMGASLRRAAAGDQSACGRSLVAVHAAVDRRAVLRAAARGAAAPQDAGAAAAATLGAALRAAADRLLRPRRGDARSGTANRARARHVRTQR